MLPTGLHVYIAVHRDPSLPIIATSLLPLDLPFHIGEYSETERRNHFPRGVIAKVTARRFASSGESAQGESNVPPETQGAHQGNDA